MRRQRLGSYRKIIGRGWLLGPDLVEATQISFLTVGQMTSGVQSCKIRPSGLYKTLTRFRVSEIERKQVAKSSRARSGVYPIVQRLRSTTGVGVRNW